jgi:hypothetical protein
MFASIRMPDILGRVFQMLPLIMPWSAWHANGQAASCPPNIDLSFGNFVNWRCFVGNSLPSGMIPRFANPVPIPLCRASLPGS